MEGQRTLSQFTGRSVQIRFWPFIFFPPEEHLSGPLLQGHTRIVKTRKRRILVSRKNPKLPWVHTLPAGLERSVSAGVVVRLCGISGLNHHMRVLMQFQLQEFSTGGPSCENEWEVHEYPFTLTHFSCDSCPAEQNLTTTICCFFPVCKGNSLTRSCFYQT